MAISPIRRLRPFQTAQLYKTAQADEGGTHSLSAARPTGRAAAGGPRVVTVERPPAGVAPESTACRAASVPADAAQPGPRSVPLGTDRPPHDDS